MNSEEFEDFGGDYGTWENWSDELGTDLDPHVLADEAANPL